MTDHTPVGWPKDWPTSRDERFSPEPVGWQGIPHSDEDPPVLNESVHPDEVTESSDVSRETEHDEVVNEQLKGYDIILGSGRGDVSRETFGRDDAERLEADPDEGAVGDAATTVSEEPVVTDSSDAEATPASPHVMAMPAESLDSQSQERIAEDEAPRRPRRSGRPRVPSFERMASPNWRDEPETFLADHDEETSSPVPPTIEKLPRPAHARILTVANQKGGVGKTTTTVNVAAGLAQAGLNVLVIDIDPQGNASTALGIDHHAEVPSVYDVIVDGMALNDVIVECPDIPGLWCAPATIDLAGAEIELVSLVARESRLHRAIHAQLAAANEDAKFDYIFIDCPPSLGLLTVNAFVAADEVFIPIQCEYYALEGLSQLLKNIEMIKVHLNPGLHVSTILLTMYDGRTRLAQQVAQEVRDHFPEQVLEAMVPRSVRISEAPSHGETVMTYDPGSTGAQSYRSAVRELAMRGNGTPEPSGRIGR